MSVPPDPFAPAPGEVDAVAALPVAALRRLAIVASVVAAVSLIPFAADSLRNYRYWQHFDASPLLRAVTLQAPVQVQAPAGNAPPAPGKDEELDDAEVAQLAGLPPAGPAALPAPATVAAQDAEPAALVVDAAAYGDQTVWLEGDLAWGAPLFQALIDLAHGRRNLVRIGHWGDSHIANDGITDVTRKLLQARFGDGGHGFTLGQGRTEWYVHKGVVAKASEDWRMVNFLNGNASDGAYGYGGVALDGDPGDNVVWTTPAKHPWTKALLYLRSAGKATWTVKVDAKTPAKREVGEASGTDFVHTVAAAAGKHTLSLRLASGRGRLYGVAFERDQGVVYDSLGEVGARGTRWNQANAEHLGAQMKLRHPDAIIINYGGNERQDKLAEASYAKQMASVIKRLRGGRTNVACLVFGPSDHGIRQGGDVVSDPAIVKLIHWQRKIATEAKCLFFDTRATMGGDGAMGKWVKSGLGWSDYSHFTALGEKAMGQATYRALLKGLADWRQLPAVGGKGAAVLPGQRLD